MQGPATRLAMLFPRVVASERVVVKSQAREAFDRFFAAAKSVEEQARGGPGHESSRNRGGDPGED